MEEKTVTMMEGVAREWRVRVKDSAGNVLNPEGFSFYGAAADGVQVPRRMQVHVEGDVAVLRLPGLWMSGRCWRYQVLCQDVLTGVEWVLCQGDVVLERRVACNGPALHDDAVLVDAVLDSELEKVEVYLGDSTAASAEAARLAEAARAGAEAAAKRVAADVVQVEDLKRVTRDVAAGAALDAERAEDSKRLAVAAARDAVADAQLAEVAAAEAEASREAAEAAQRQAAARAAEADASAKVSADAASDALAARDETVLALGDAEAAKMEAQTAESNAKASETQAAADKAAAEQAKTDAQAAQVKASEEATRAEAAQAKASQEAAVAVEMGWSRGYPVVSFNVSDSLAEICAKLAAVAVCQDVAIDVEGSFDGERITDIIGGAPKCVATKLVLRSKNGYFRKGGAFCRKVFPSVRELWVYQTSGNSLWDGLTVDYLEVQLLKETAANWSTYLAAGYYKSVVVHAKTVETSIYCPMYQMNNGNVARFFDVKEQPNVSYFFKSKSVSDSAQLAAGAVPTEIWANVEVATETFCNSWALPEVYLPEALPKLKTAEKMFNNCRLSAGYLLKLLPTLPTWTDGAEHLLTIGVHADHQADEELRAAIDAAVARGWTISEQWNGTAAATTFARRPGPPMPVYAKLDTYTDEEGNEQRSLSWCHQVSSPDGKEPEELGYTMFASVEAGREYFGLPEEDLTETE